MSNPLIQKSQQSFDINALFEQFKADPSRYLKGFNIPNNLTTPEQIVRYIADCGRVPDLIKNQVYTMLRKQK